MVFYFPINTNLAEDLCVILRGLIAPALQISMEITYVLEVTTKIRDMILKQK